MVYFNYQRSIFRTIRRFIKKLVSKILNISYKKVTIILFIVSLLLTFFHNSSFASSITNDIDNSVTSEEAENYYTYNIVRERQKNLQKALVLFSINPYLEKSDLWTFLDDNIYSKWYQSNTYVSDIVRTGTDYILIIYNDLQFHKGSHPNEFIQDGVTYRYIDRIYRGSYISIQYNASTNTSSNAISRNKDNLYVPEFCTDPNSRNITVVDDSVIRFIEFINSNSSSVDYSELLDLINTSLNSIDGNLSNISSLITTVNNSLNTIIEKLDNKTDYSGQISDIRDSLDNLAQQQQQTQDTIKDESQAIQNSIDSSTNEITNTLTDNDVSDIDVNEFEDIATNVTDDPTQNGFNNIFETIRNALVNENTEPLKITIPFTNKSFEISAETVYGNFSRF